MKDTVGRHIAGSVHAGSKIKRLSRGSERLGGMRSGLSAVPPGHCFDVSPSIGAAAARGGAHLAKKSFQTSKRDLQFSIPLRGSLSGGQPCENRLLGSGAA